jgi:hypothetical protein
LVADRSNIRIQILSLEGEHRETIISRGLRAPCTVRINGDLTLIPDLFGAVVLWDRSYQLLAVLGSHPARDTGQYRTVVAGYPNVPLEDRIPGRFNTPHGIARDSKGNIYVGEWFRDGGGRITKLVPCSG